MTCHYYINNKEYKVDRRTVQLLHFKSVLKMHIAGLRSRFSIVKVGKRLGFKSRTAKSLLKEVQAELDSLEDSNVY